MISVTEYEDGFTVTVVYGTSRKVNRLMAGEFAIRKAEHEAAFKAAGLSYDTKFDLRERVELPWNDRFFSIPPHPANGQTPKLGSLHIDMHRALIAAAQAIK